MALQVVSVQRSAFTLSRSLSRCFASSTVNHGFKDIFVLPKDLNKRPSDEEIERKGLPKNTPTLEERIRRDSQRDFYATDRKGGYYKGTGTLVDYISPNVTLYDVLTEGYESLKTELIKFKNEQLETPPLFQRINAGEEKVEWKFDSDENRNDWITTADSTWGEGYSSVNLQPSQSGRGALFSGNLVTRPPPDGRTQFAGYAAMKSVMQRKSFYRIKYLPWEPYTHLVMNIRGDGRTYTLNLHTYSKLDVHFFDLWQFPLYTRGGPYWQKVKIPFSKFVLTSKGSIQDKQEPPPLDNLVAFGITLKDRIDGPFALEVDRIGVVYEPNYELTEEHAYEEYTYPRAGYDKY